MQAQQMFDPQSPVAKLVIEQAALNAKIAELEGEAISLRMRVHNDALRIARAQEQAKGAAFANYLPVSEA